MEKLKISEICSINPRQDDNIPENSEISFIPMAAVSANGQVDLSDTLESSKVKNYTVFRNGDVLFAKITPCMENGKGAIVHNLVNGYGAGSTEFIVLRPNADMITAKWLYLYLSQRSFRWECQQHMTGSAGQKRVPPKYLASCEIPVPPVPEQERIVSKIEEMFSKLEASVAELQTAKEKLKVYRQAVLEESLPYDSFGAISQYIESMGQGWSPKCANKNTIDDDVWAVIKTTAVQHGYFDYTENKILPDNLEPRNQHEISVGDILITRAGPRSRCGVCCLVRKTKQRLLNCDKVYQIKPNRDKILPEYMEYVLNSPRFLLEINRCKTGGNDSGVNLTQSRFLTIKIPVPSVDIQKKIVEQIESRLSMCDSIECTIDTSLRQAEALRQSILKQAFEGRL
ncbi:restriction endonuclease subunit S [Dysosmobacter welbionis]|jgi:hypothetical protein